jgi:hypothetical protein
LQQKKLTQILNKINFKALLKNKTIYFLIVLINSTLFTIYYGYRGVFPIDSFLIFDAGYKVLNNIHPFKDYWSITGPLLDYIQSVLFLLFKVNWFSYVLHAALINCLLSLVSFYFFINIGLKKIYALLYALSIAILAYPATGTPFMDYHAAIFATISLSYLILAFIKTKKTFWFLSSLFLVFSFFSKQIPGGYLVFLTIITIIIYLLFLKKKKDNNFLFFALGGITGVAFFFSIFLINEIPVKNFLMQYIYYPITIGENRTTNIIFNFKNVFFQFKFIYLSLFPALIASIILFKKKNMNLENKLDSLILILIFSSFTIFLYTQIITKNQILIFFLIPFYLGISHYYTSKYFNKKLVINFIILILVLTTTKYHLRFNEGKKFMELVNADFSKAINAKTLDDKLSGLKWITPYYTDNPNHELNLLIEIKKIIIKDVENKIIITDYQILPAITGNLNYAPNKWFDALSVPSVNNKYFEKYKLFFLSKLKEQKIKNIYVVGEEKLDNFIFLFDKKDCMQYKKVNEISLKLDVSNCL